MEASMDVIGWRRFIQGTISKEVLVIQRECVEVGGHRMSLEGGQGVCSNPELAV